MQLRKLLGLVIGVVILASVSGCPQVPVGDPCVPETAASFDPKQVSVETRSLQCRTRVCLVYYDNKTFCSCRCARPKGISGGATPCACPPDSSCEELITTTKARDNIRGSYCVPKEYVKD